MSSNPKVSVIMSAYNETNEWLSLAIESVLNQTFKDFEFVIILDNPNNVELKTLIEEYKLKDNRIVFSINEQNMGLIKSLNRALTLAKGEYIARMDADDICYTTRLEKQIDFLENNKDIALLGTSVTNIGEKDEILEEKTRVAKNPENIKKYLRYTNVVVHPTIVFRRSMLDEGVVNYRNVPFAEDYDFMCRVVATGHKITNLDEPLLKYRIRENSISREKFLAQLYNAFYLKKLYISQLEKGVDLYNEEHLYSDDKISKGEKERFRKSEELKRLALEDKNRGNSLGHKVKMVRCKLMSKYAFLNAMSTLKYKISYKFNEK